MLKHADATCHRILVGGKSDTTYNKGSVNTTANFFLELVPDSNVYFETKIVSPHLVPGIDPYLCWWEEWGGPDNCTDMLRVSFLVLKHVFSIIWRMQSTFHFMLTGATLFDAVPLKAPTTAPAKHLNGSTVPKRWQAGATTTRIVLRSSCKRLTRNNSSQAIMVDTSRTKLKSSSQRNALLLKISKDGRHHRRLWLCHPASCICFSMDVGSHHRTQYLANTRDSTSGQLTIRSWSCTRKCQPKDQHRN